MVRLDQLGDRFFPSRKKTYISRNWSYAGKNNLRAKTEDKHGKQSDRGNLKIKIPRN
jgi:hypothetical protein